MSDFRIAVVGMAGRFPQAENIQALWEALCEKKNLASRFSATDLAKAGVSRATSSKPNYVPVRAALSDADCFDFAFFGYSPHEAKLLDPQHRIFLECSWSVLEDAGYAPDKITFPVGVFAGASPCTYLNSLGLKLSDLNDGLLAQIGTQADFLSTRVSYKLGLTGPSMTVQTGCSTSLVAVHLAVQSLLARECDMALAGGSSIRFPQQSGYLYEQGGVYSPDGLCRAFDEQAGGVFSGNGVAIVALKRFEDAVRDGDPIRAVILATAVNNDGKEKIGFTAPSETGQSQGLAMALQLAGISAEKIGFVEAHGTGTLLGDPIEVGALKKAFRAQTDKKSFCALGSVKSNLGHLDAASGVTGLIKACLALENKKIPATLNFNRANPQLGLDESPFYVNSETIDWPESQAKFALVNSFGIGGTNAHVVLQSHDEVNVLTGKRDFFGKHFLPLSAKTKTSLDLMAAGFENLSSRKLEDQCHTLQTARSVFAQRSVLLLHSQVNSVGSRLTGSTNVNRKICFMFPGGGAQYFPMGAELYDSNPAYKHNIDTCANLILQRTNTDIRKFLFGPTFDLSKPQPELYGFGVSFACLFATEFAMAQTLMSVGIEPEGGMIGHSLGEYIAATLAGVFDLKDALDLVVTRGELFAKCASGAMLSVRCSEKTVNLIGLPDGASVSARNAPELLTVSGPLHVIEETESKLTLAGLECRRVPLQVPAHCNLLDPVLPAYAEAVLKAAPKSPRRPMISNLTGTWLTPEQATSVDYWVQQMRQPVNFALGLETLTKLPVALLEVGPGRVLSGLARANSQVMSQAEPIVTMRAENEAGSDNHFVASAVAKLWICGASIDWLKISGSSRRVSAPGYRFDRTRLMPEGRVKTSTELENWFYTVSWRHHPLASVAPLIITDCVVAGAATSPEIRTSLTKMGVTLHSQDEECSTFIYFPEVSSDILENTKSVLTLRDILKSKPYKRVLVFVPCIDKPEMAPFVSAAKVLPQEDTDLSITLLKYSSDSIDMALSIALSSYAIRDARVVSVCADGLYIPEFAPMPLHSGLKNLRVLRENGCYLITGGLGTVGLHLAHHLSTKYKARVALVSRREDHSSVSEKILECEAGGGRIFLVTADTSNRAQMEAAFEKIEREFGEINGVLHAAGVTSGPSIQAMSSKISLMDFETQFQAKIAGTRVLDSLLEERDLDFILLFSSNASILGGVGMLAYSAANIFMDLFAAEKWKGGDRRWLTATWDGWRVAGKGSLRKTSLDRFALQPDESVVAFERIVQNSPVPTTVVSKENIFERAAIWLNDLADRGSMEQETEENPLETLDRVAPKDEIERKVAKIWEELLGVKNVGINEIFFDLGGHSLYATRMLSRLRESLGIEFPLFRLFENPTVAGMAAIVKTLIAESPAKPISNEQIVSRSKTKTLQEIMAALKKE